MLNQEFLNDVLSKDDLSVEDKISQIIAEHDADTRGLISKRDELLGSEKKLKEQIKTFGDERNGFNTKIAGLEEELKKNSPEEHKKYYDAQLLSKQKEFDEAIAKVSSERDFYKTSHLKRLEDDAIAEGVKSLQFIDGLKDGFIFTVLGRNKFEPKEIDGQTVFLTKDNKTIQECIKQFSLSPEGKAYLKNPSSGSGAGSSSIGSSKGKSMTREEYDNLVKTDPIKASAFFADGGKLE